MGFLDLLCCFNWLSPTKAFVEDVINGGYYDIGISTTTHISEKDVKRIMRDNGIRQWGTMRTVSGKTIMTTVHPRDAKRAIRALRANGIKPEYG